MFHLLLLSLSPLDHCDRYDVSYLLSKKHLFATPLTGFCFLLQPSRHGRCSHEFGRAGRASSRSSTLSQLNNFGLCKTYRLPLINDCTLCSTQAYMSTESGTEAAVWWCSFELLQMFSTACGVAAFDGQRYRAACSF